MNKKITYLLLLSGLLTLNFACSKKDLPDIPYENNPVFNVNGTIGNETIDLHAGENDALMFASAEEYNGVNRFTGVLSNGQEEVKMQIFGTNVDIPHLSDKFIELPEYLISEQFGTTPLLTIEQGDLSNASTINTIDWSIDGDPHGSSTLTINEPGKYNVCANVHYNNGAVVNVCNTIIVGFKNYTDFELEWEMFQSDSIVATFNSLSATIQKVRWYMDDVIISEGAILYASNLPDSFHLRAEVHFQNGAVAKRTVFVNKQSDEYSLHDFTTAGIKSQLTWDSSALFTVVKGGSTYQSINGPTSNSSFVVTEITEYETNNSATQTKLIKGTLNVPFKNFTSGETVNANLNIEFGLGY